MGTLDIRRIELRMAGIVLGERDYLIARGPRDVSNRQPVVNESLRLSLPKMLSGANAFEISDIERMNIGAHQPGV
jgi:hypothetical protein